MKNSLFPKRSALEILISKRQSLFKKRAKRDVSIFGGPGSGRYPRGSGKNPQASKRNKELKSTGRNSNEIYEDFKNASSKKEQKSLLKEALQNDLVQTTENLSFYKNRNSGLTDIKNNYDKKEANGDFASDQERLNYLKEEMTKDPDRCLDWSLVADRKSNNGLPDTTENYLKKTLDSINEDIKNTTGTIDYYQSKIDNHPITTGQKIDTTTLTDADGYEWSVGKNRSLQTMIEKTGGEFK